MNISNLLILKDTRLNSLSVSCTSTIGEYLTWYKHYGESNKLDEQRPVLNTRSANMVRKRLIEDLTCGAIIPPIVIGMAYPNFDEIADNNIEQVLKECLPMATVIDGMQRTEALSAAVQQKSEIADNPIRIEFWISVDVISLIYRMLVLNSGQTPWDTKRQLEVVYKPLLHEVEERLEGLTINYKNDRKRRTDGGIYQASSIVELYMAFSSRKELISTPDKLADEFTRLDIVKMSGSREYSDTFFAVLNLLVLFDSAICKYKTEKTTGICSGMDLFTEMPAKVGFVVALAQYIVGRSGEEREARTIDERKHKAEACIHSIIEKVESLEGEDLGDFLSFDILNEKISMLDKRKIGNAQREYYKKVFSEMLDIKEIDNMSIVWLSA